MRLNVFLLSICLLTLNACQAQEYLSEEYSTDKDLQLQRHFPALKGNEEVVYHKGFALVYSERHEQPSWVGYLLTAERANGKYPRRDNFREDSAIVSGSARLSDYKGSGYSRGHLAPAGDMKWDPVAMDESFLMSNMSPQSISFNDGLWNKIENQVRQWARWFDTLYVFTGPVLHDNDSLYIGESRVTVPLAYYKVVYSPALHQAIGLLVPHKQEKRPWYEYAVSVDEVEAATGIDFLHGIADEENLERNVCSRCWKEPKKK